MPEQEARIKQYFLAKLEGHWKEWEEGFAAEPADVRARVEALWAAEKAAGGFLSGPVMGEPEADAELKPGTLLGGRYEVRELLGAGAFAQVYRALDRRVAGKETAVKVFHSGLLTEALLQPEVRAMALVSHPAIMRVTDVGATDDGRSYLVRDYFAGETLRERMARGPIGAGEAREIVLRIAEALTAAHEQGLIHCDLKPENILINAAGRVALIDFGLADLFDGATRKVLHSSNRYTAPELQDAVRPEPAADIYSLGKIWMEMGHAPRLARAMQQARPEHRPAGAGATVAAMTRARDWRRAGWVVTAVVLAVGAGAVAMRVATPATAVVSALVPVTSFPGAETQPALTPDGTEVFFSWRPEGAKTTGIYRVEIGGGTPLPVTPPGENARFPAVSPDGKRLAYLRYVPHTDRLEICWMPMGGGEVKQAGDGLPQWVDWMPDSRRLLVGRKRAGPEIAYEMGLLDLDSGNWQLLRQDDGRNRIRPSVSPDGTHVAYHMQVEGGPGRVVVGKLGNGRIEDIGWSNEYLESQRPLWTADGRHIVFLAGRQNNRQVHAARWNELGNAQLLPAFGQKLDAVTVARRRNVAVVAHSQEDQNIWRIDLAGAGGPVTDSRRIAETTWDDEEPAFVETTGKVVYVSDQSGGEQIWEANDDGSDARRITDYSDGHQLKVWGLAGQKAVLAGGRFGKEEGFHVLTTGGSEVVRTPGKLVAGRVIGVGRDGASVFVYRAGVVRRVGLDGKDLGAVLDGDVYRVEEAPTAGELWYTFKSAYPVLRGGIAFGEPIHRRLFATGRTGVYFVSAKQPGVLQYRPFAPGSEARGLVKLPGEGGFGIALRTDERMLLLTMMERTGVDLLAVKEFRLE